MNRLFKLLLAVLAAVFVLLTALMAAHYGFPYASAARLLARNIEASAPMRIGFDTPAPGRPFVCRVPGIRMDLVTPNGGLRLMEGGRLTLRLHPLSLAAGRVRADFTLEQGRNRADGHVDYALFGSNQLVLKIERMNWPDFSLTDPGERTTIRGKLGGSARMESRDGLLSSGSGSIHVQDGRLTGMNVPDLPLKDMDFQRLDVEFSLTPSRVNLKRVEVAADQGGLTMAGRIQDFKRQALFLSGTARLGPAERPLASFRFRVLGTLTVPRVIVTGTGRDGE